MRVGSARDVGVNTAKPEASSGPSTWSFTVPGQPPSGNHKDETAIRWTKPRNIGEKPRPYMGRRRATGVEPYMLVAKSMCQRAKPKGWEPAQKIRITYVFYLGPAMDGDNSQKVLNDALAIALGCDDKRFLTCVMDIIPGCAEPHTYVTITNLPDGYSAINEGVFV